jgi:hypothetical protein
MCSALVSGFLTIVTQQIHSLRWIGVRPFHLASRSGSEVKTSRRSGGTSCITPAATCSSWALPAGGSVGFAAARLDLAERFAPRPGADSRLVSDFMLQSYALGGLSATGRKQPRTDHEIGSRAAPETAPGSWSLQS